MDYKQYVLDNLKFVLDGDINQLKSIALVVSVHTTLMLVCYMIINGDSSKD